MSDFPCWETRESAEPDFVPPACDHDDCDSYIAECRWQALQDVCMLPENHDGPHGAWAKDDIELIFVDAPLQAAPAAGGGQS